MGTKTGMMMMIVVMIVMMILKKLSTLLNRNQSKVNKLLMNQVKRK